MIPRFQRKKRIEVTCPRCGHRQEEPARVISTVCQACGEHFRVRKGVAIPDPGSHVSGIVELEPEEDPTSEEDSNPGEEAAPAAETTMEEEAWLVSADEADRPRPLGGGGIDEEEEEPSGISAGAFFGLGDGKSEPSGEDADGPSIGEKAQARETLARGSMGALIDSGTPGLPQDPERMPQNFQEPEKRRKSGNRSNDIEVRCFRCYYVQKVSRFAKSTQCERCSVYISLANFEVSSHSRHTLRTRGDITIGRRGSLRKCEIACHNLTVHGSIDALVDCSGTAVFRGSGVVRGHVHCRKLLIEKQSSISFPDGVKTRQAEIAGKVTGDITCSGTVRGTKTALIEGAVRARAVELKDGATITGEMTIDPETRTDLPVKMGFNPSVIG